MDDLMRLPAQLATLQSEVVATSGRLARDWSNGAERTGFMCDLELIKTLTSRAGTMFSVDEMDGWLAPRLHCALRIPRRVACDDGMWTWLALQCSPFIVARFQKGREQLHPWRYRGAWSRNGLSRLWWGAEMTRNGPDYSATELCFRRTRTAQFALELMYSWDRGAAIAFVRVAEGTGESERLSDATTNALSTRIRVYLSLRSLDSIGVTADDDSDEFDESWASHSPSLGDLLRSDVASIPGPSTGNCTEARIAALTRWMQKIASDIRLQGEASKSA